MKINVIFWKIWKDNVGGNLIAWVLIGIITLAGLTIKSSIEKTTVFGVVEQFIHSVKTPTFYNIVFIISVVVVIVLLFLLIRLIMKKANPIDYSILNPQNSKIFDRSTVFFAQRLAKAFPGDRGIVWYNDSKVALKRLLILLDKPLTFESASDESSVQPIWWFRDHSSMHISKFIEINKTKALMNENELQIKRIAVNIDQSYFMSFVYVEVEGEKQTGLYKFTQEDIERHKRSFGYSWEEYGLYKDKAFNRQEHDDGSAVLNGKIISINESELRVRYLTDYNFIITSHQSPYNSPKFDLSKEYFDGILCGTKSAQDLFEFLKAFRKNYKS